MKRIQCRYFGVAIAFGLLHETEDPRCVGSGFYFANRRGRKIGSDGCIRSSQFGTCHEALGALAAMVIYIPTPICTEGVELPPGLGALVERLAENNHSHWARQRLEAGWSYGPRRDDVRKTHPDLVPYGDLPDDEKEYDRTSVVETLKVILELGYEIVPRPTDA